MRRKEAAAANLHSVTLQIASLVCDAGANCIAIRFCSNQIEAHPVMLFGRIVSQQKWRPIVDRYKHVDRAVVIKITDCHSAGGERFRENRAALCGYVLKTL